MKIEVLISCMHQKDRSIIERSNIQTDVVVVNQCDIDSREEYMFLNKQGKLCHALLISTTERGLSRSRNMAIANSTADICLICDDDEILNDHYPLIILEAFKQTHSDLIAFKIENTGKKYSKKIKKIGYLGALKLASWQLAFKRESILRQNIKFDITLGSGVSKAGGEENMFVYDCLKVDLRVMYIPRSIGKMIPIESKWFYGFTKEYFYDRGTMTRKLMGLLFASIYAVYYLIRKYPLYEKDINFYSATKSLFQGLFRTKENTKKE